MPFNLSLKRDKEALGHLLNINKDFVFLDGAICSLHSGLFAFGAIIHSGITVGGSSLNDCSVLANTIKSRHIDKMTFDPLKGIISVGDPYEYIPKIKVKDDSSVIDECVKRLEAISSISDIEPGAVFTDKRGTERSVVSVKVNNSILADMLDRLGTEASLELVLEKGKLEITNQQTGDYVARAFPAPDDDRKVSVLVTEDAQKVFASAFLEQYS